MPKFQKKNLRLRRQKCLTRPNWALILNLLPGGGLRSDHLIYYGYTQQIRVKENFLYLYIR